MADADGDGKLSRHEFAVAMHLAASTVGKSALSLPEVLPPCLAAVAAAATGAAPAAPAVTDPDRCPKNQPAEGKVILVDDAASMVSSLGSPAGLSDAEGPERVDGSSSCADPPGDDEHKDDSSPAGPQEIMVGGPAGSEAAGARSRKRCKGNGKGGGEGEVSGAGKGKKRDRRYDMCDEDAVRYGKTFDKLTKSKETASLGGKEVRNEAWVYVRRQVGNGPTPHKLT